MSNIHFAVQSYADLNILFLKEGCASGETQQYYLNHPGCLLKNGNSWTPNTDELESSGIQSKSLHLYKSNARKSELQ